MPVDTPTPVSPFAEGADSLQVIDGMHRSAAYKPVLDELRASVDEAVRRGSTEATRTYLSSYRRLAQRLAEDAIEARPDFVVDEDHQVGIADVNGHVSHAAFDALLSEAAHAPFNAWTTAFDVGDAVALDLTNRFRVLVRVAKLDAPGELPNYWVEDVVAERFFRRVRHHLNAPDDEQPLARVMRVLDLSKSELGRLFRVSRQAIDGWIADGVPAERREKLAALLALCDLLERKLKTDRIAGVARREADAYGGRSMLQMIADDRHRELLESVRDAFDWSQPA
jgi:hypothetical protein